MPRTNHKPESAVQVRPAKRQDIDTILAIQSRCYGAATVESAEAFLSKRQASPTTCFMAWRAGTPVGYLFAVPATLANPPRLNSPHFALPAAPDCLYLHDLSVEPAARGTGTAEALVTAFLAAAQKAGYRHASLTAVNDSASYWARHGFHACADAGALQDTLASYGAGALYMCREIGRALE